MAVAISLAWLALLQSVVGLLRNNSNSEDVPCVHMVEFSLEACVDAPSAGTTALKRGWSETQAPTHPHHGHGVRPTKCFMHHHHHNHNHHHQHVKGFRFLTQVVMDPSLP